MRWPHVLAMCWPCAGHVPLMFDIGLPMQLLPGRHVIMQRTVHGHELPGVEVPVPPGLPIFLFPSRRYRLPCLEVELRLCAK